MRIIIAGDRFWSCRELTESTLRRLIVRHGPAIVIVHGGAPGVDQSFAESCRALGVKTELCFVDFSHVGDYRFSNRQMIMKGAGL
jgi:acetylglutamate kinase